MKYPTKLHSSESQKVATFKCTITQLSSTLVFSWFLYCHWPNRIQWNPDESNKSHQHLSYLTANTESFFAILLRCVIEADCDAPCYMHAINLMHAEHSLLGRWTSGQIHFLVMYTLMQVKQWHYWYNNINAEKFNVDCCNLRSND